MAILHGLITDTATNESCFSKVRVIDSKGDFCKPEVSTLKIGSGLPFFYSSGEFYVDVPRGPTDILVERGTEYIPLHKTIYAPNKGIVELPLELERWSELTQDGWYPGNTHIHYDENEQDSDNRLKLDPLVHDFNVTVISILQRGDLDYATNKYPIGLLNDFSTPTHLVDVGEESRHNKKPWEIGYGHVMFINIKDRVEPLSRGILVDQYEADYPPLSAACDDAHNQGGLTIWCHNGNGMEAPVAAILGKLDAFNLFDPYWSDLEYDIYYKLLNCGVQLPVSTGSDWFVCNNNRVYVQVGNKFRYDDWLSGMQKGRTFITNGPTLFLQSNDTFLGESIEITNGTMDLQLEWKSHYPINTVELILNGNIISKKCFPEGSRQGEWETNIQVTTNGWLAARCSGAARDSFHHAMFAHTSPIYIQTGRRSKELDQSAKYFINKIDAGKEWISNKGVFSKDQQKKEILALFNQGKSKFMELI